MAKTDTLHVRIDPGVKEKAEETLNDLGLSISYAVNVFLKQVILNEGIPFEIKNVKQGKKQWISQHKKPLIRNCIPY